MISWMTAAELEAFLYKQIPISRAFGARVVRADRSTVEVTAPLSTNINHLGTAFGGSLNAILVLAGYTWLFQALEGIDPNSHVILKTGHTEYLRPVKEDIRAICSAPESDELDRFLRAFRKKGKSRIVLKAVVLTNEGEACRFTGEFVAQGAKSPELA